MRKKFLAVLQILLAFCFAVQIFAVPVTAFEAWTKNGDGKYYNNEGTVINGVTSRGIDISSYQGEIDWDKLYREEYLTGKLDFVIIRCGFGDDYFENGVPTQDDAYFYRNADACTRLGIPFGVYLFSYADTYEHAYSEVQHVLRMVKGYTLSYPIYFDVEWTEGIWDKGPAFFAKICDIFCGGLQKYGYEVGVYSFRSWFTNDDCLGKIDYEGNNWGKWIAEFGPKLNYYESFDIWQCTSSGSVSGIAGRCDINFAFIDRRTVDHCYLTFDLNGGSASRSNIEPMHVNRGSAYGGLPVPVRSGYVFDGWFTEETGGTRVTEDTIVPNAGKQTLYAHWREKTYTVTLELSDIQASGGSTVQILKPGEAMEPVTLHANSDYKLPASPSIPEGLRYDKTDARNAVLSGTPKQDVTVRLAGVENERLQAPAATDFTVSAVSAAGKTDGSVQGVTQEMEYSVGNDEWRAVTEEEEKNGIKGLAPGEVLLRMRATSDNRESLAVSLTVLDVAPVPAETRFTLIYPMVTGAPGAVLGMDSTLEYSLDGGKHWNVTYDNRVTDVPDWGGIRIRFRETENCLAGESLTLHICTFLASEAISFEKTALCGFVPSENYLVDGKKVKADGDGLISIQDAWCGKTVTVCADLADSVSFSLTIPEKRAAPSVSHTDETIRQKADGTISGLSVDMEYSTDGKKWSRVTKHLAEKGLSDLRSGTYYVRYAAVKKGEEQTFAGKAAKIEIEPGRKLVVTYHAEGFPDTEYEVSFEGVLREIPELPSRNDCIMEQSYWSIDLSGTVITEDTEVHAVYQLTKTAGMKKWIAEHAVLLIVACVTVAAGTAAAIVLALRHRKKNPESKKSDMGGSSEKTAAQENKIVSDTDREHAPQESAVSSERPPENEEGVSEASISVNTDTNSSAGGRD